MAKGKHIFWLEKITARGIEKVRVKENKKDFYLNLGYKVVKEKVV